MVQVHRPWLLREVCVGSMVEWKGHSRWLMWVRAMVSMELPRPDK